MKNTERQLQRTLLMKKVQQSDQSTGTRLEELPKRPRPQTEEKYPEGPPPGIQPGTGPTVTPLKHVQMYIRQFSRENVNQAKKYILSQGSDAVPPIFLTIDTRGEWSVLNDRLYWQASNGSTRRLEVVPQEDVDQFIEKAWYKQDLPSGIFSLHNHLRKHFLGITRSTVAAFVKRQKPWQMLQPKRNKEKFRTSQLAKRPFTHIELDIADMVSFGQTSGEEDYRFVLVLADNFSGFCMAEVQLDKSSPETLKNFKKMLNAIAQLGYPMPRVFKSDQGPEFSGPGWSALDHKHKWLRQYSKNYPCVRVERKIRTLKTYLRLNSTLTRGEGTKWYNVVNVSVTAVNRIHSNKGGSPFEMIIADRAKQAEFHGKAKTLRDKRQRENYKRPKGEPQIGDSCRVSLLGEKERPRDYKGHLPYDKDGKAIKWSDEMHTVEKKRVNRVQGSIKVFAGGRWRFWPSEVLIVPADTVPSSRLGQDGNADFDPAAYPAARRDMPVARTTKSKKIKLDPFDTRNIVRGRRRRKKISYKE